MAGNAIGGVVIDGSRHVNRILDIDTGAQTAVVEPGVVLTDLLAAARPHGLAFGADPSSASRATLGGMIANNACGAHSVAWGTTADNRPQSLDVVLADGTALHRRHSTRTSTWRTSRRGRPGREGELHRALQAFADEHELMIRRRFGHVHAADLRLRAASVTARARLRRRRVAVRQRRRIRGDAAGNCRADAAAERRTRFCVYSASPTPITSAECVPVVLAAQPADDGVDQHRPGRPAARAGTSRRPPTAGLPAGQAWLLVEMGGEDERRRRAGRREDA